MANKQKDSKQNKTLDVWVAIGVAIGAGVGVAKMRKKS